MTSRVIPASAGPASKLGDGTCAAARTPPARSTWSRSGGAVIAGTAGTGLQQCCAGRYGTRFMTRPAAVLDDFLGPRVVKLGDNTSAPIDGAKPLVSQEGIEDADRSPGLRAVADDGIRRIAAVEQVPERDAVPLIDANCE